MSWKWGHRLSVLVASAIAVAALATACGEDNPEFATRANTTVTTGALTKTQFIARVESYCRESWQRALKRLANIRAANNAGVDPETLFADATKKSLLPRIQFQFDEIRNAGAPEGEKDEVEMMVGAMQIAIESAEEMHITSPAQLANHFAPYNELALKYGLDRCLVREAFFGVGRP